MLAGSANEPRATPACSTSCTTSRSRRPARPGRWSLEGRRGRVDVAATKSSATDVVTEMDRRAEALLVDRLLLASVRTTACSARRGPTTIGSSGIRWVLDPIDGTVNYLYGLPEWAVSVAAEIDGIVVVGVVAGACARGDLVATIGRRRPAARQDGVRDLRVNDPVQLEQALVATGFGYTAQRRRGQARVSSRSDAAGARHPPRRRLQHRPLLGGSRARRRVLSSAAAALGPRGGGRRGLRGRGRWCRIGAGDDPQGAPVLAANPALIGRLADLLAEAGDPGYRDAPPG